MKTSMSYYWVLPYVILYKTMLQYCCVLFYNYCNSNDLSFEEWFVKKINLYHMEIMKSYKTTQGFYSHFIFSF